MDHRLSQILGRRLSALIGEVKRVAGAVVVDDLRMIDRDIGRPLFELVHRVTAFAHHLGHQPVGLAQRARRLVDEPLLQFAPGVQVALARLRGEWHDLQTLSHRLPLL
jgi:hypothetical protein